MTSLRFDTAAADVSVDLDTLLRSRLLIQANSGAGKSQALRGLLEQTHGRVLQLVLDPEGEFATLREHFPFVLAGKDGDVPAHPKVARVLCRRLLETNASAIIDLYDLTLPERREFVKLFLTELMAVPRSLWKPALVVIDEAHTFAPERGHGEAQSTDAVIALCTQGRKRGFCAALATQRISKLHKDAAAELLNKLIGRTGLDVDMKRAGDELGMDRDSRQQLRDLAPGEFFSYGPAIGVGVQRVRTAPVRTAHPDARSLMPAPPANASVQALVAQIGDLPTLATKELDEKAALEQRVKDLQVEVRRLQSATRTQTPEHRAAESAAVKQAVKPLQARLDAWNMARHSVVIALGEAASLLRRATQALVELDSTVSTPESLTPPDRPTTVSTARSAPAATIPNFSELARDARARRIGSPNSPTTGDHHTGVSRPQQRMLDVVAQCEAMGLEAPSYGHVAVWSNQSPKSSGFEKNLSTLCAAGYLARKGNKTVSLTDAGRSLAAVVVRPPTLQDLHDAWMPFVSAPQQRMLRHLIDRYPHTVAFTELAQHTEQSPTSSGYEKNVSTLSSLGLLERQPGKMLRAGPLLFPPAIVERRT